jgi:hypothetical protein
MPWIPAAVHDGQGNDFVVDRAKVHGIRKSMDERPPCVAPHARIGQRILKNPCDRCFDRRGEDSAQAVTLSLVPSPRIEQLRLGLGSKCKARGSRTSRELPAHLFPGDGAARIRQMLLDPSVELRLLLGRQNDLRLTLLIAEAVPERHGKLYPILGGQLEKGGERVRQHA